MHNIRHLLATIALLGGLAAASTIASAQTAPSASPCGAGNAPCACSYECCGQERCDGPICNQCVAACLRRATPTNNQFTALQAQCQKMIKQGFRRL